eukprot:4142497-Prymnesium_polylepis.1
MPTAVTSSEAHVLKKKGYVEPSLRAGLWDAGEMMGTLDPPATCAAVSDAVEHPAPMIALTPSSPNAYCVRYRAACRAVELSHFESLYENFRRVWGSRSSLALISLIAWMTPTRGDHDSADWLEACVLNIGNSNPSRTSGMIT